MNKKEYVYIVWEGNDIVRVYKSEEGASNKANEVIIDNDYDPEDEIVYVTKEVLYE